MKQYTLDEKIKATNHACDVLTDTRLKLQKAFGLTPDGPAKDPFASVKDVLKGADIEDLFGGKS